MGQPPVSAIARLSRSKRQAGGIGERPVGRESQRLRSCVSLSVGRFFVNAIGLHGLRPGSRKTRERPTGPEPASGPAPLLPIAPR